MRTHTDEPTTCTNVDTCTHPDHERDGETTCEDRAVGCRPDCPCCMIPERIAAAAEPTP